MDSLMWILVTWTVLPMFNTVLPTYHGPAEFCQWEDFEAPCADDEMIVIRNAIYGRMRQSRCAQRDFGYLGCETDVLDRMHRECSGRHLCTFKVTNLHDSVTCPKDLTAYLAISYDCTKVVNCRKKMCETSDYLKVSPSSGYLSSQVTWESGCGTARCPWVIQAQPGQRINITLMDFSGGQSQLNSGAAARKVCYRYATLKESSSTTRDVTLCPGEDRNEANHVYLSESNFLSVTLYTAEKEDELFYYAIKYEGILGCPTLAPPRNSWVKHSGDSVAVYCNSSKKEWHLRCSGNSWIGEVGVCDGATWIEPLVEGASPAYGMLIIIGLGVAIGVVVGGLLLAVTLIYLKRKRNEPAVRSNALLGENGIYSDRVTRYDADDNQKNSVTRSFKQPAPPPYPDASEHDYTCTLPYRHPTVGNGPVEEGARDPRSPRCESIQGDSGVDSADFPPLPDFTINREHIYESPTFPMQVAGVPMRGSRTQSAEGISRKIPHDEGCSNRTN